MTGTDYRKYKMSVKECILYSAANMSVFLVMCKVFFDSLLFSLAGILLVPFLLQKKARALAYDRREALALEFKDFILALSASLKTGYSVENAFVQAGKDLALIYDEDSDMVLESRKFASQLQNNKQPEELLSDFAQRSGQNEISDFAAIFHIAKRSGGNMGAIIRNTADIISEKIEVKKEIQVLFAAKRMEQNIMNLVPVAIIGYVRITTPDYFDTIYHTAFGILFMGICLVVYVLSFFLSRKIMDIEV